MKIIYGIQGTGNGHLSRSRDVVQALKKRDHDVFVVVSGRPAEKLWEMDVFQPFIVLPGMTFVTRAGKIRKFATWKELRLREYFADVKALDCTEFDLAITDYEPIVARAAKRDRVPVIGLGHQYAFFHPVPMARGDLLGRFVTRRFAPVDLPLGMHYHHFNCPILPPSVPRTLVPTNHFVPNKIVTYLPFEAPNDVFALLNNFPGIEFFIYGHGNLNEDDGHLHLRPPSRDGFLADILDASGVISSAGFALSSECLHLGKKLLVKPVAGQIEQESNAIALQQLGLASIMPALNPDSLESWLSSPPIPPQNYPDVAAVFAHWVSDFPHVKVSDLISACWQPTERASRSWDGLTDRVLTPP